MALTKRELHRRISAARGEAAAMLFFRLLPKGKKRERVKVGTLRYEADQTIKGLVAILNALLDGDCETAEGNCGACGHPIRGGQKHVHTEDAGNFHATKRCWSSTRGMTLHVAETQREQDREARKRRKEAREYLKAKGMIA